MADNKEQETQEANESLLAGMLPLDMYYTIKRTVNSICQDVGKTINSINPANKDKLPPDLMPSLQNLTKTINASLPSFEEDLKGLENAIVGCYEQLYNNGDLSFLVDGPEGITGTPPDLLPQIEKELQAYKEEKGLAELPLRSLLFDTDQDSGELIIDIIIKRAGGEQPGKILEPESTAPGAGAAENLNSIRTRRADKFNFPIDKPNSIIWGMLAENTHGQIELKAEPNGSKKEVNILYSIDFDVIESNIPIVKRLTQYDKRVYIAAGALYDAGNSIITIGQIYHAMGYTGKPGKDDREKIDKSFTKFAARITINNNQEIDAGYKYPRFEYDGELLPFERVREHDVLNGQLVEETIHLFREPPLLAFARGRKQLTTYPLKVLQSPNSKTERNLAIEDYLLERIAKAKRGTEPRKILLSTIYDHANIKTKMQRSRAPQTIATYLDHYEKCGEIKSYTMDKTSITLELNAPQQKKNAANR